MDSCVYLSWQRQGVPTGNVRPLEDVWSFHVLAKRYVKVFTPRTSEMTLFGNRDTADTIS